MTSFERHPRLTLTATVLLLLAAADGLAGLALTSKSPEEEEATGLLRQYVSEVELHAHRVRSPLVHHGLRPNDHFEMPWGSERRPEVWTNSLGLRDAGPRLVVPDPGCRRIVVLGDSFVEGLGVRWEDTFVGITAARLAPLGVEVLNAGIAGYSPKLYYLQLRRLLEVERLRIDDVVVYVDTSDPHNEIEYETWEPETNRGETATGAVVTVLQRHSFVTRVLTAAWRRWEARADASRLELLQQIDQELYAFDEPVVAARWGRHGVELCERYMQQLADLCRARGIRLTIAVHPSPVHVLAGEARLPWVERWDSFARKNGARFLDLFAVFIDPRLHEKYPPPPGRGPWYGVALRYYIPHDVHWNETGHRLVAEKFPD